MQKTNLWLNRFSMYSRELLGSAIRCINLELSLMSCWVLSCSTLFSNFPWVEAFALNKELISWSCFSITCSWPNPKNPSKTSWKSTLGSKYSALQAWLSIIKKKNLNSLTLPHLSKLKSLTLSSKPCAKKSYLKSLYFLGLSASIQHRMLMLYWRNRL